MRSDCCKANIIVKREKVESGDVLYLTTLHICEKCESCGYAEVSIINREAKRVKR